MIPSCSEERSGLAATVTPVRESGTSGSLQVETWVDGFRQLFARVAVLAVRGTAAQVVACGGVPAQALGKIFSLVSPTPLRWAVEAASPTVSSGVSPGGKELALGLGLTCPRAFVVVPIVLQAKLVALVYADMADGSLPMTAMADLLRYCDGLLGGDGQPHPRPRLSLRRDHRSRVRRPLPHQHRRPRPPPPPRAVDAPAADTSAPAMVVAGERLRTAVAEVLAAPLPVPTALVPMEVQRWEVQGEAALGEAVVGGQRPARKRRWLLGVLGLMLLSSVALRLFLPLEAGGEPVRVRIPPRASFSAVVALLAEKQVVTHPWVLQLWARATGDDRRVRAGSYRLRRGLLPWQVLAELVAGQMLARRVTIPEGFTAREVAMALQDAGIARASDIVAVVGGRDMAARFGVPARSVEGYLFPETYTFAEGESAADVVARMVTEFFRRLRGISETENLTPAVLHRRVILASMVQREAKDAAEMSRVAGVFRNRLDGGMRLESCATVQYVLGIPKGRLTLKDVRTPSPYNTYLHEGLPPGPIGNPGEVALRASFHPERHDYLFFFARRDGSDRHFFTRSYAEHRRAQRLHR